MGSETDEVLLPLSPMDTAMHSFGFVILYIFPPSASSSYNLHKLQSSFITLVEEDYPILIGELYVDPATGIVNVKQTKESQERGAVGIQFETNTSNSMTTEKAMKELSWDLMPTSRDKTELICIKGTMLSDGGLAIGVNASHTLFDGEAMFTFMTVWGQHYSEVTKENRVVVTHDRQLLGGTGAPSTMPHPEFRVVEAPSATVSDESESPTTMPEFLAVETESEAGSEQVETPPTSPPATTHQLFHFSSKMMKNIKEVATKGGLSLDTDAESSYVSTVDALTALFTVLISRARGHKQDVRITTGVNGRRRLSPPLPLNYVGNVIFNALSTYTDSELQSGEEEDDVVSPITLSKLARRVRESVLRRDDAYMRDAVNFLTEQSNMCTVQVGIDFVFGSDLMFTSWLHMGMYKAEFNGTHPWYACVPQLSCFDGFVMMTEAQKGGDGIDVGVFLECSAMEKLKDLFAKVSYLYK